MIEVRCLTVRQPWAWAIAWAGKDVENRSGGARRWGYRGWLAIHAGEGWSERGRSDPRMVKAWCGPRAQPGIDAVPWPERITSNRYAPIGDFRGPAADRIEFGVVVAIADLVDVHDAVPGCCEPWGEQHYVEAGGARRADIVHLAFGEVFPLRDPVPVPHGGRLGIWRPEPELAEELSEQLTALRCLETT